jgi:rhamnogalacturonan endolyase
MPGIAETKFSKLNKRLFSGSLCGIVTTIILGTLLWGAQTKRPISQPSPSVTISENASNFVISNGIITAQVAKRNGDLRSLVYQGIETLTDRSGHAGGYWSHDAGDGIAHQSSISIDPGTNGGERGEVSIKAISGGRRMGHPAGLPAGAEGDFPADIEIRYALGRGESGLYTYSILDHKPEYPAGSMGEARFCAKLAEIYDWLSVDDKRNKYYPHVAPGEDKYVYTAIQSENLAYGWSSTKQKIGWWLINPTIEYLSGGPTKVEFLCHRDTTPVQAPCVLNYWRSSHYGGAVVNVASGESWTKVIGPFYLYMNSEGDPMALWKDAREQAKTQASRWPFIWVQNADYPHKDERSLVSGQIELDDPLMPGGARILGDLMVGLTAADPAPLAGSGVSGRLMTWQTDAKHYQYWAKFKDRTGKFSVSNVRPGIYTLHAYADGILGELSKENIRLEPGGRTMDLGTIRWAPVRRGRELWQVGIPNRTATEFAGGNRYFEPDTQIQYARLFPNDVNFIIGKSDVAKDWYFEHIPHNTDPNATIVPFSGVRSHPGDATPYTITFIMHGVPRGTATLRLALCAGSAPKLIVSVNGQPAGEVARLNITGDSTLVRHNIQGIWFERELSFNAALMKQGTNTITLTIPSGPLNNGVIYDCVRLELDEGKPWL